jgi:hypothetical protein
VKRTFVVCECTLRPPPDLPCAPCPRPQVALGWLKRNHRCALMVNGLKLWVPIAVAASLLGSLAKAEEPKEIKTEKGKAVILGNFLNAPSDCSSNPGPSPLPQLREKPSHGILAMQIVVANVPATDSCPARKIPAIALFYSPSAEFVGTDSVQIEFETGASKIPGLSVRIIVQGSEQK